MEGLPSPSPPPSAGVYQTHFATSTSPNSSLLDLPSSIYMFEDGSVKSSAASFVTTGRSETRPDSPIAYDELFPNHNLSFGRPLSPTTFLQLRARSRSLGAFSEHSSDLFYAGSNITSSLSSSSPSSSRASLDGVETQFSDMPAPSYERILESTPLESERLPASHLPLDDGDDDSGYLPPPRHPILPKPEEGNEILPGYTCTVFRSAIVNRKVESFYPGLPAKKREWTKVYMIILGTVLRVYLIQTDGTLPSNFTLRSPDREYTLQYAEAGIASDYLKRKFVIRVRLEGEQFLMQCQSEEERDGWVESIQAGSGIALALEERNMPKFVTLPRRRRGRYAIRSRPVHQRVSPSSHHTTLEIPHLAQRGSNLDTDNTPERIANAVSSRSIAIPTGSCASGLFDEHEIEPALALALCLNAGRSRPSGRERILITNLTARQTRLTEFVVINGVRRRVNIYSGDLEEPLPEGVDLAEDEHRVQLQRSRRSFPARLFSLF
jgi:PH domain